MVVPCHRYAHLLPEAVASAVAQTYRNLRIVIVDDGSPDDTAAVAARLAADHRDRRIDLVRQPNRGLGAARNAGIRATDSPLLLPLDADDRLHERAVERLVATLTASGADVATPQGRTFGAEDRPLRTLPATRRRLVRGNCLVYSSLFRRELFDRIGGYATDLRPLGYEDWDFWLGALEAGARFVHVDEPLFLYRRHGPTMLAAADAAAMQLRARIVLRHPRLYSRWRAALATRILRSPACPDVWARLGFAASCLLDRRLRLLFAQLRARCTTNMLST